MDEAPLTAGDISLQHCGVVRGTCVVWTSSDTVVYHCDGHIVMSTNGMAFSDGEASIGVEGIIVGRLSATEFEHT